MKASYLASVIIVLTLCDVPRAAARQVAQAKPPVRDIVVPALRRDQGLSKVVTIARPLWARGIQKIRSTAIG